MNAADLSNGLSVAGNALNYVKKWLGWFGSLPYFGSWLTAFVSTAFFLVFQYVLDKCMELLTAAKVSMQSLDSAVANVDPSFLERVNYVFPLDTLATCVLIYLSAWAGVTVLRYWLRFSTLASEVVEKIPVVQ